MKEQISLGKSIVMGFLILINFALAGLLVWGLDQKPVTVAVSRPPSDAPAHIEQRIPPVIVDSQPSAPASPFAEIYSPNPSKFAANLRAVGCPEQTVNDILVAEVHRMYQAEQEALKAKPWDHVPRGWSSRTSEARLLERRQQAAALARTKSRLLHNVLGYEVPVSMPLYATTSSELEFEESLYELTPAKRSAVRDLHDRYWSDVKWLQEQTRGFWQSEDIAALDELKRARAEGIQRIINEP